MNNMNSDTIDISNSRDIYTVSRLNREVRTILETGFPLLWIEAELSNFARPASGHWYFSLKDEAAQVKCAMFKNRNQLVKVLPKNGNQVLVRAKISLYEPRGDYQLIIEHMEEAGDGALRRQFELLKNKLSQEGLFDAQNKKAIPDNVRRVGIITSSSGAAIHDILTTLKRRYPMDKTIIYPVPVQGKGASQKIAAALYKANQRNEVDVLIVARGGGSLEDLWQFNEEVVARAIYESSIPVVTGIGHEVDFTIADFVADQRAATPTAAAELISPDRYQYLQRLKSIESHLVYLIEQRLQRKQQQLDWLGKRLRHPKDQLAIIKNRLNELQQRNIAAIKSRLQINISKVHLLQAKVQQHNPAHTVKQLRQKYDSLTIRFNKAGKQIIPTRREKLKQLVFTLDAVSPLHTLKRGYAIIKDDQNHIVRNVKDTRVNQVIKTELAQGSILSTITEIHDD